MSEELVTAEAERYVAVVLTSGRAFGLATESAAFSKIDSRLNEAVQTTRLTSNKVTVRTTDRLLMFESTGKAWKEHRF